METVGNAYVLPHYGISHLYGVCSGAFLDPDLYVYIYALISYISSILYLTGYIFRILHTPTLKPGRGTRPWTSRFGGFGRLRKRAALRRGRGLG